MKVWKLLLAVVALVSLASCGPGEKRYEIEGVPIILEDGRGPSEFDMLDAVMSFRNEAKERFELERRFEVVLWSVLEEVRWTDVAVPGDAVYVHEERSVRVRWRGCAWKTPLYRPLVDHYTFQLSGDEKPVEEHRKWANELNYELAGERCP